MKFFIYSRKSVYTGKGESVENQIEMCRQYINTKFENISDKDITIYEDEGFSAKNTNRPQFKKMLRDIKTKKPDFIVCYRLDRISRNVSDFSSLIEDLNDREISFVCIKEEFDTSKPMGKAMMYIASVFAQLERETIAERVRDNMLMLARNGQWLGGTTPMGYTSERVQEIIIDGKIKTYCKLKEDEREFNIVKLIFEKFLELHSLSGVSKYLINQDIKSRNNKYFSPIVIKEILQNPVYCIADKDALYYFVSNKSDVCFEEKDCSNELGLLVYNKRNYNKKNLPRQLIDKWIISVGKHKGCISGNKWIKIQNIIKDNIPTGDKPAKMHNDYSLLSGLIYCEKCGNRMFAKHRTGKNKKSNLYDYICNGKISGGVKLCNCQNINGYQADDMICDFLMSYDNKNSDIYKLLEQLKIELNEQSNEDAIKAVEQNIKKCNDEIDNLINISSKQNIDTAFIKRINTKINTLDKELSNLNQKYEELQKGSDILDEKQIQINMILKVLSSLKNNFSKLSIQDKRTLIKIIVKKIIWDGSDFHIFINGG